MGGIILVYSITNKKSFENLTYWICDVLKKTTKGVIKLLVGNKSDLNLQRQVSAEEGMEFAKLHGMTFIETSAKDNVNIDEAFELLTQKLLDVCVNEKGNNFLNMQCSYSPTETTKTGFNCYLI